MNYYKRHLGDFARDTAHLSQGQVGAYDLLLDWYYANERAIPLDKEDVYRIARAHSLSERKNVDKILAFFTLADDGYHQKRADTEITAKRRQSEINKETGKKGGRPRKESETEPNGNRIGFDSVPEKNPSHKPLAIEKLEKQKPIAQQAARFPEFWTAYPVKKGRVGALKAWTRRGLDAIADVILADVEARKLRDRQWLDGFIPHGSTYVNGNGWEDAIEERRGAVPASDGYAAVAR